MKQTKEPSQVEVKKEVDNTNITSEGGDMKVSEPEVKKEKPKKPSAKQEDGSYKVNLSETPKTKEDAGKTLSKGDDSVSTKKEPDEKSGKEKNQEGEVKTPVLEEITDSEEKTEETTVKEKTKEPVLEDTKKQLQEWIYQKMLKNS